MSLGCRTFKRQVAAAFTIVTGCGPLAEIPLDRRCGNRILEPSAGETCDTFSPEGLRCGAPDTPLACQLVCGPAFGNAPCPVGWMCGADGACRAPAGSYTRMPEVKVGIQDPYGVKVADFDGDGRKDLAFLSGPQVIVRYGDGNASFSARTTFNIDTPLGNLAVGDLDRDGRADLVIPEDPGPLVVRGQPTRTLDPVAIPICDKPVSPNDNLADRRLVVVPSKNWPYDEVIVLGLAASENDGLNARCAQVGTEVRVPLNAGGKLGYRVGAYGLASLDPGFRRVAVSHVGEPRVSVFEAGCGATTGCSIGPPRTVRLDSTLVAGVGGVMVGDVDGDGRFDIVVTARVGHGMGPPAVGVAFGRPDGGYCRAPGTACTADGAGRLRFNVTHVERPSTADEELGVLLALFDLDEDGRADFIFAGGILQNEGIGADGRVRAQIIAGPRFKSQWGDVAVGDFNRDDRFDVATAYPNEGGIEFLISAGNQLFNRTRVESGVPTPFAEGGGLHVGDFDGDLFQDVAFVEQGDVVWVAFGDPQGAPTEVVSMGSFGRLHGIAAGHFDLKTGLAISADAINDLFVLSSTDAGSGGTNVPRRQRVTVLTGTSERRMLAPVLFLSDRPGSPGNQMFGLPVFTQTGQFTPLGAGAGGLLAVTREQATDAALWLARGAPGGQFVVDASKRAPLDPSCALCTSRGPSGFEMVGKLVPQSARGPQRLVLVERASSCRSQPGTPRRPLVVELSLVSGALNASCERLAAYPANRSLGPPRRLRAFDADGDGQDDLLIQHGPTQQAPEAKGGGLLFYRGRWSPAQAPRTVQAPAALGRLLGFDRLPSDDPGGPDRMALVGSGGIAVGRLDEEGIFNLDRYVASLKNERNPRGQSLRVFDADGDGLEDILWIREGKVTVFVRDPCTAVKSEEGRCVRPPLKAPPELRP